MKECPSKRSIGIKGISDFFDNLLQRISCPACRLLMVHRSDIKGLPRQANILNL
jgi:hypothetical protein